MLLEEGLDNVFARHQRLAAATRAAVNQWGLEVLCQEPQEYSPVLTAVLMPPGHDADQFRQVGLDNYRALLTDSYLWTLVFRTVAFCLVNAGLTLVIGLGIALLLRRMSRSVRLCTAAPLPPPKSFTLSRNDEMIVGMVRASVINPAASTAPGPV